MPTFLTESDNRARRAAWLDHWNWIEPLPGPGCTIVVRLRVRFILVCLIVLALSQGAWAQEVAAITQSSGTAQVLRVGATKFNNVTLTMPVEVHDRLTAAADSTLTFTLVDTSTLSL